MSTIQKDVLGGGVLVQVAGPLKDFAEKLGGPDGMTWFAGFKRFLRKENPWGGSWPIWKTITIGGKSTKQLLAEMKAGGFLVSDWARDIMGKPGFTTLVDPIEVSLVRLNVRDLGFTERPTTTELFVRAKEQGINLCPAEVGPHLRLALMDQPRSDWFWVAMEQITDSGGFPNVFHVVRHDDGLRWLNAHCAYPGDRWDLEYEVVFHSSK